MSSVTILKSQISRLGGLEKVSLRIAKAFLSKGCKVDILTSGPTPPELSKMGIDCFSHSFKSSFSYKKVNEFDAFCKQHLQARPSNIVFGMDRNSFQTHLRAGNGVHAAYLAHRKDNESFLKGLSFSINPLHRLLLKIEKDSFESPSLKRLFVNSHMVQKEITSLYNVDPQKIEVVHNGVEWQEMELDFQAWENQKGHILQELGLKKDVFHFLFIGHNFKRKGLEKLLHALPLLLTDFHLSVVGKDKDLASFQALCAKLSLKDKVTFFGSRTDIRRFYQFADALVIPSFYDPFANVTVEALSMGLFVVSSKTNGGHEVLNPSNGSVIESLFDKESFAEALEKAMLQRKTKKTAEHIRQSAAHLDYSRQLEHFIQRCLA